MHVSISQCCWSWSFAEMQGQWYYVCYSFLYSLPTQKNESYSARIVSQSISETPTQVAKSTSEDESGTNCSNCSPAYETVCPRGERDDRNNMQVSITYHWWCYNNWRDCIYWARYWARKRLLWKPETVKQLRTGSHNNNIIIM